MSSIKTIKKNAEKKILKKRINELLDLLEMSRNSWKKIGLKVTGTGLDVKPTDRRYTAEDIKKWGRHKSGYKPGLKSQYSVLWDLYKAKTENEEFFKELKIKADAMKEQGEAV